MLANGRALIHTYTYVCYCYKPQPTHDLQVAIVIPSPHSIISYSPVYTRDHLAIQIQIRIRMFVWEANLDSDYTPFPCGF